MLDSSTAQLAMLVWEDSNTDAKVSLVHRVELQSCGVQLCVTEQQKQVLENSKVYVCSGVAKGGPGRA